MSLSTRPAARSAAAAEPRHSPAAVGMGVVFLWGLAVQYAVQGIGGRVGRLGLHHGSGRMAAFLAAALVLVVLGEGLRRGAGWARMGVVTLALLVVVLGVSSVLAVLAGHGMPGRLVLSTIVELTLIPWIAWRLSLPRTAAWFAAASASGGRSAGVTWREVAVGWALYAAIVADRLAIGGFRLALPSGRALPPAVGAVVVLAAVPLAAALLVARRPAPEPGAAAGRPGGARVQGGWLAALAAWSVAWGIAVAVTQGIGQR
jgi:hypothetical protein